MPSTCYVLSWELRKRMQQLMELTMDTGCTQSHGDTEALAGPMWDLTNLQNQGHLPGGEDPEELFNKISWVRRGQRG